MGQYYKAIALDKQEWMCPHDYDNGLKLMEHSWIKNNFVSAVESLLIPGGDWHEDRIVWAGDYADPDEDNLDNLYSQYESEPKKVKIPKISKYGPGRFIVNHTENQYIDKATLSKDNDGWTIHPLPLLTCEGNGRGGGDYRRDNSHIGDWARDQISIEKEKPEDFEEIIPHFTMD